MLRRSISAFAVLCLFAGFLLAETGVITSLDVKKREVTVKVGKKDDQKDVTVKIGKSVKFQSQQGKNGTAEPIEDYDLKKLADAIEKAKSAEKGPKGVLAQIETKEEITTITLIKRGKKKE